ncbi:putative HMG box-containing protein C10F6.08c [Xylogone sp. PMI_703]|nr:putative HMG box-containing protein C10F6.08c [Xylogone sp. PMI_703]
MAPASGTIPPPLPPSVEESYRRKCVQLKQRMNEVEEANDASRLRLVRMQRAIEKMRLERAFLMEQLAKRTSTNVEDSEGSPSPPPTPKEKPLRTKRGHRKPSFLQDLMNDRTSGAFIQAGPVALSPSSDAFSHNNPDAKRPSATTNGHASSSNAANKNSNSPAAQPPRRPRNAFELYCNDLRSVLTVKNRKAIAEGKYDVEMELASGWRNLDATEQARFQDRFDAMKKGQQEGKDEPSAGEKDGEKSEQAEQGDEDVEMADEHEEAEPEAENGAGGGGGFTAINRD